MATPPKEHGNLDTEFLASAMRENRNVLEAVWHLRDCYKRGILTDKLLNWWILEVTASAARIDQDLSRMKEIRDKARSIKPTEGTESCTK